MTNFERHVQFEPNERWHAMHYDMQNSEGKVAIFNIIFVT